MDVEAIIHFVGLVVFTTQVSTMETARTTAAAKADRAISAQNKRVVAILPSVKTASPYPQEKKPGVLRTKMSTSTADTWNVVEPHSALLIFEAWTLIDDPAPNWVKPLSTDPNNDLSNFQYIELNHDRVSFVADRPNSPATVPAQLRSTGGTLAPAYRSQEHQLTAAVFDIPAGKLTACTSRADGVNGRMDTELRLNTSGSIKIQVGAKSVTLDAGAVIYVVNVPFAYASEHDLTHTSPNHYLVYCRMVGIADADCVFPALDSSQPSCPQCYGKDQRADPDGEPGKRKAQAKAKPKGPSDRIGSLPFIAALASWECSNSKYP